MAEGNLGRQAEVCREDSHSRGTHRRVGGLGIETGKLSLGPNGRKSPLAAFPTASGEDWLALLRTQYWRPNTGEAIALGCGDGPSSPLGGLECCRFVGVFSSFLQGERIFPRLSKVLGEAGRRGIFVGLPRVLEVEAMDTPEEAVAYDTMDHSLANQAFVEDLLAVGPEPGWVVDLGAGTLQIPLLLCQKFSPCWVLAVDLAWWMLWVGWSRVEQAGLAERVIPCRADAKCLPLSDDRFRTVISNSLLHHLPEPELALREAWRIVAPGGLVFIRDLFRPDDEATIQALVAHYAPEADGRQQQMFADSFRASLTLEEVRTLAEAVGIPSGAVYQSSDRHWTLCARKPG